MVVRVVLATGLAIALMAALANGAVLRRAGVTSSCSIVHAGAAGAQLVESCRAGWLDGFPNLSSRGCSTITVSARLSARGREQYWSCPVH